MKKIFLLLTVLALLNSTLKAQDKIIELRGKLINIENKEPVRFANIINLKKRQATITDTAGNFRIVVTKNDTLRISSIGFEIKYFSLANTQIHGNTFNITIYMKPKIYDIETVNIYEERWKAFVYDFTHTEIKEDITKERIQRYLTNLIDIQELRMITQAARGPGFTINFKNKRMRSLLKVEELKKLDELEKLAAKKYNKKLVSQVTGLQGEELTKFMRYCRFDPEFIIKTSEYDLIVIIQEIYEIYKEKKL